MTFQPALVVIALAAVVPPLVAAVLVGRTRATTARARLAAAVAFVWGAAVAAMVASPLNDAAGALVVAGAGPDGARWIMPALGGPLIEELAKAGGFVAVALVAPGVIGGVGGGIAIGVLLGLGFAATENVDYYTLAALQGGGGAILRALYLRGIVEGANHATFTAMTGAGAGWAARGVRPRRARLGAIVAGLAAAVALHGVWNGIVSRQIATMLCNAPIPDGACTSVPDTVDVLIGVPLLEAAFLAPAVLALAWLVRGAR